MDYHVTTPQLHPMILNQETGFEAEYLQENSQTYFVLVWYRFTLFYKNEMVQNYKKSFFAISHNLPISHNICVLSIFAYSRNMKIYYINVILSIICCNDFCPEAGYYSVGCSMHVQTCSCFMQD